MIVHNGLDNFTPDDFMVVTSGTFDGVHFGHGKILRRVVEIANANGGKSVVLTFWPHPRFVLGKNNLQLLTTLEEKTALIANHGIDHFVTIPFTREFSEYSSSKFIQEILVNGLGTKKLVIGYDHRFGKNREGSFEYLVEHADSFGFSVEEIPAQDIDNIAVSSTKIRNAFLEGHIDIGNEYLGRSYCLTGIVVKGEQIGRSLGFPTANLHVAEEYKLIPADGIYAVEVILKQQRLQGMLYIGPRPTLNGKSRSIEVNIFDFDQDIYGEKVTIEFIKQIRQDAKFESLLKLAKQLEKDKVEALKILRP